MLVFAIWVTIFVIAVLLASVGAIFEFDTLAAVGFIVAIAMAVIGIAFLLISMWVSVLSG